MKQIVSGIAVLLGTAGLTIGLAGSANAGTLKSAPLFGTGNDMVACGATNVSAGVLEYLTVWIIDDQGAPAALSTCQDVTPGASCFTQAKSGFCGVVFPGSAKRVRGSISIVDEEGKTTAALPVN